EWCRLDHANRWCLGVIRQMCWLGCLTEGHIGCGRYRMRHGVCLVITSERFEDRVLQSRTHGWNDVRWSIRRGLNRGCDQLLNRLWQIPACVIPGPPFAAEPCAVALEGFTMRIGLTEKP